MLSRLGYEGKLQLCPRQGQAWQGSHLQAGCPDSNANSRSGHDPNAPPITCTHSRANARADIFSYTGANTITDTFSYTCADSDADAISDTAASPATATSWPSYSM